MINHYNTETFRIAYGDVIYKQMYLFCFENSLNSDTSPFKEQFANDNSIQPVAINSQQCFTIDILIDGELKNYSFYVEFFIDWLFDLPVVVTYYEAELEKKYKGAGNRKAVNCATINLTISSIYVSTEQIMPDEFLDGINDFRKSLGKNQTLIKK